MGGHRDRQKKGFEEETRQVVAKDRGRSGVALGWIVQELMARTRELSRWGSARCIKGVRPHSMRKYTSCRTQKRS